MQVVGRASFDSTISYLSSLSTLSLDTETTGLRPYHGDKLFSLVIGTSNSEAFYFNFKLYEGQETEYFLTPAFLRKLAPVLEDPSKTWYMHNAKFDLSMLYQEGLKIGGKVYCTLSLGRIEYNEHKNYDLDSSLLRIGLSKDDSVEKWIKENKATSKVKTASKFETVKHYDRVPFEIITKYGLLDATGTFALGTYLTESIKKQSEEAPSMLKLLDNEVRLTKTVFNMESHGVLVDLEYCKKAIEHEQTKYERAARDFREVTGRDYQASPRLFQEIFQEDKEHWEYTEKGNPSFESNVLRRFNSRAARHVLILRDTKSRSDFYRGFIYHRDSVGRVHPSFVPSGAAHGRFTSARPNFQNLTADEEEAQDTLAVRRAIIPPPGFTLYAIDYSIMEYRFMLEQVCKHYGFEIELAKIVNSGVDYHQAVADIATKVTGTKISRSFAKTANFLNLYGGGVGALATTLKITLEQAKAIRESVRQAAPEIYNYCKTLIDTAQFNGYIFNWFGRKLRFAHFRQRAIATQGYVAPNYVIAGGCADIVKIAMNQIDDLLIGKKSKMTMCVHDELIFEISDDETYLVPKIKFIMENAYKAEYVSLKTSVYKSNKSLADLDETRVEV